METVTEKKTVVEAWSLIGKWKLFRLDKGKWVFKQDGHAWKARIVLGESFYLGYFGSEYWATTPVTRVLRVDKGYLEFLTSDSYYQLVRV